MGTSRLKSSHITQLDTSFATRDPQSAGAGPSARCVTVCGTITPVAADAAGSTYQMVRIPTNAIVKYVGLASQAQGAGKVQIGVYYSDATDDGTPVANQGLVVPTTGVDFFASDVDLASAIGQTDETFQHQATAGAYNPSLINKRLWDALGLTSDPGGFFDIVLTVHTTAITTGTGFVSLQVEYAE